MRTPPVRIGTWRRYPSCSSSSAAGSTARWDRGAICGWELEDPETGELKHFRVTYIRSSEEATQVAKARERALAKAEQQLGRVYNGLGGRYYKTRCDCDW